MKKYNNFILESTEDELEKQFIQLARLDELYIRFNFKTHKSYTGDLYYYYDKTLNHNINLHHHFHFRYNKSDDELYINYGEIWKKLEIVLDNGQITYNTENLLKKMVKKYFNIDAVIIPD